jgi:hypothetical protein
MWKVFLNRFTTFIIKLIADYVAEKVKRLKNKNTEIIYFSIEDHCLVLESERFTSKFELNELTCNAARAALAQNTTIRFGIYWLLKTPMTYVLIPKFSFWFSDFKRAKKYIKDWKGSSLFGTEEVIKYKTFWDC